jgi:hypothetical protein
MKTINERYKYDESMVLGVGTHGTVYGGVKDDALPIAIKVLKGGVDFPLSDQGLSVHSLVHPNIVKVHDILDVQGSRYIVMDCMEENLADYVHRSSSEVGMKKHTAKVLQMCLDVAEAIKYSHQKMIYHQDLYPPNILISVDGKALVSDFFPRKSNGFSTAGIMRADMYTNMNFWHNDVTGYVPDGPEVDVSYIAHCFAHTLFGKYIKLSIMEEGELKGKVQDAGMDGAEKFAEILRKVARSKHTIDQLIDKLTNELKSDFSIMPKADLLPEENDTITRPENLGYFVFDKDTTSPAHLVMLIKKSEGVSIDGRLKLLTKLLPSTITMDDQAYGILATYLANNMNYAQAKTSEIETRKRENELEMDNLKKTNASLTGELEKVQELYNLIREFSKKRIGGET